MPFNTKSYLAGVGTVFAAVAIGFSGGFFLAPSTEHVEQNRLQRVTSSAPMSNPAPQAARSIELVAAAVPAPSAQQPSRPEAIPAMAKAVEPATGTATAVAKAAEPVRAAPEQNAAKPEVNTDNLRAAEAKAERKRAREQRSAERRKQREIALATAAVKRMVRDRDPQRVADFTDSPRFGFFGEN